MKLANQLPVSPLREGVNALKVYPGHLLGRTWSRPVSINLIITSRCNSKCATCDSWKLEDHSRELTTADYERLAKETADLGIPIVTIGGGEPTLRKDLFVIVRAFKDQGRVVQLTTNGLTLRPDQRETIYESGLDRVTLSLDSHREDLYEEIRGVPGAEKVLGYLSELLKERPPHLEVDTNTVLCAQNADTFLETIDTLIKLGVPKVNISAVTTSGDNYLMTETKAKLAEISEAQVQEIVEGLLLRKKNTGAIPASSIFIRGLRTYYKHPDRVVFPCFAGYLTLDVFEDGSVHGCGNLPSFANVRDASLKQVWYGPEAQKNREDMAAGRCPSCYLSCKIELAIAGHPRHLPRFSMEKLLSPS